LVNTLFDTLRTFAGCCARQKKLHQFSITPQNVSLSNNLASVALLIILWSTVQVCHALPTNGKATDFGQWLFSWEQVVYRRTLGTHTADVKITT
jgi:hypothetical protein